MTEIPAINLEPTNPSRLGGNIADAESTYYQQVEILERAGVIGDLSTGEKGIVDTDGKEYTLPSLSTVQQLIESQKSRLEPKVQEGYNQILLVPFAADTNNLLEVYRQEVIDHLESGNAVDADGNKIEIPYNMTNFYDGSDNVAKTPWGDWQRILFAHRQMPDQTGAMAPQINYYQGVYRNKETLLSTKELEIKKSTIPGWQILLLKDEPELPEHEVRTETKLKIFQLVGTPEITEYQQVIEDQGLYGLTMEAWLAYALMELEVNNRVIDYNSRSLLLGMWYNAPVRWGFGNFTVGWAPTPRKSSIRGKQFGIGYDSNSRPVDRPRYAVRVC